MIPKLVHLPCKDCGKLWWLSLDTLSKIQRGLRGVGFVDFVCECGAGRRHFIKDMLPQEATSISIGQPLADPPLIRAAPKCGSDCDSPGSVYAVKESDSHEARPRKKFEEWKLRGITCGDGKLMATAR
jgi:hypothetical protein